MAFESLETDNEPLTPIFGKSEQYRLTPQSDGNMGAPERGGNLPEKDSPLHTASRKFDATVTVLKQNSELRNLGLFKKNEDTELTPDSGKSISDTEQFRLITQSDSNLSSPKRGGSAEGWKATQAFQKEWDDITKNAKSGLSSPANIKEVPLNSPDQRRQLLEGNQQTSNGHFDKIANSGNEAISTLVDFNSTSNTNRSPVKKSKSERDAQEKPMTTAEPKDEAFKKIKQRDAFEKWHKHVTSRNQSSEKKTPRRLLPVRQTRNTRIFSHENRSHTPFGSSESTHRLPHDKSNSDKGAEDRKKKGLGNTA